MKVGLQYSENQTDAYIMVTVYISSLLAWLARLWEVTVKSGLVVIVSKTEDWNKDNLAQYFGNK